MIVSLVLSVLIGVAVARHGGAAAGGASGRGNLIGFSLDTLKEARWQADSTLFVNECKSKGDAVKVISANGDDDKQLRDVQSLLTDGVRVLVIVPHNGVAMARAVALAHADGVPVIAYDRLIQNCDLDLYLSFDNIRVGEMQAQYVIDHLPGHRGTIVRVYGSPTDNNAKLFKAGQDKVLAPYIADGSVTVAHEDWADDWKPENSKRIVNAAITQTSGKFDAVLASNDSTAAGAIQALMESNLAGKVIVTGQDADLPNCQMIVHGYQTMTIYKPLRLLAKTAADYAVRMAAGRPVVARQTVNNGQVDVPAVLKPIYAVDKSNMMQTVIKDNFHTYQEVYQTTQAGG